MNTESLSTTWAGRSKGNPYNLWTRYLYNRSMFLFSFIDVHSSAAPSERPLHQGQYYCQNGQRYLKDPFTSELRKTMLTSHKKENPETGACTLLVHLRKYEIYQFERITPAECQLLDQSVRQKDTLQAEVSDVRLDEVKVFFPVVMLFLQTEKRVTLQRREVKRGKENTERERR